MIKFNTFRRTENAQKYLKVYKIEIFLTVTSSRFFCVCVVITQFYVQIFLVSFYLTSQKGRLLSCIPLTFSRIIFNLIALIGSLHRRTAAQKIL